ncbi:hypothetical protein LUZ60_006578 [Juncus effusus]|nr:hypothetical protein LUZ60_006578 [Juncus effusus]
MSSVVQPLCPLVPLPITIPIPIPIPLPTPIPFPPFKYSYLLSLLVPSQINFTNNFKTPEPISPVSGLQAPITTDMSSSIETAPPTARTAELMVGLILIIFILFLFVLFLYLYLRRYSGAIPLFSRSRSVYPSSEPEISTDSTVAVPQGLDSKIIKSLPFIVFKSEDFKNCGIDCAVCLSEVSNGEEARILPKCNHGFHLDCIDMWLFSHSTCPLCRCPVIDDVVQSQPSDDTNLTNSNTNTGTGTAESVPNFPTNVLFWGSQDQIRSGVAPSFPRAAEISVVEIPRRPAEPLGLTSAAPPSTDDSKLLTSARVRSLRRLLVRGGRGIIIGNYCSPRIEGHHDIELGFCAPVPVQAECSSSKAATSS